MSTMGGREGGRKWLGVLHRTSEESEPVMFPSALRNGNPWGRGMREGGRGVGLGTTPVLFSPRPRVTHVVTRTCPRIIPPHAMSCFTENDHHDLNTYTLFIIVSSQHVYEVGTSLSSFPRWTQEPREVSGLPQVTPQRGVEEGRLGDW